MLPFRVQCETCQTRLRVRDPGFVGEVHACPRCGSMVLITAPAALAEPEIEQEAEASPDAPAAPAVEPAALPEIASPVTVESASSIGRALAPIITAAVLTVAAGVVWLVGRSGSVDEPTAVAATPTAPDTPAPPQVDEPSEPQPPRAEITPASSPIETEEPTTTSTEAPEPAPIAVPQESPPSETIRLAAATPVGAQPSDDAYTPPPLPAEFDPLDFDPTTIDLVLTRGEPAEDTAPEPEPAEEPTVEPGPKEVLDDRLAAAARREGISVRRGPSSDTTNQPPSESSALLLASTVPAIELTDVPLHEAVEFLGALAGPPITLRPADLLAAGVDPRRPLDVRGAESTFADIIAQAFRPARLTLVTEGPHARLVRSGSEESRTVSHRLGDLDGEAPSELAELFDAVGPDAMARPTALEGGRLRLEAEGRVHYQLLLLCERLRVARGLPTQTKYPRQLLATEPSIERLAKTLERRTTFSFVEPAPLSDVFAHWRRVTGLPVLVDWRSLGDVALGPRSTIECAVTNRPWSEALDGVLEPLGLAWAATGADTIWITSRETLEATPVVEFYRIERTNAAAFADQVADRSPSVGVAYDDPSSSVIVRGNAAAQREAHRVWRNHPSR